MTLLLRAWRDGNRGALDELVPLVYGELHQLAAALLRGERSGHTFRATDLVSEAYLRLGGGEAPALNDRVHFFAIAARVMRRVLVDHARRRGVRGAATAPGRSPSTTRWPRRIAPASCSASTRRSTP